MSRGKANVDKKSPSNLFLTRLQSSAEKFNRAIATEEGDWTVRGFIDIFKNIYTISNDTKVVSKLIELMLFPEFVRFAKKYEYTMELCEEQNHYPDITFTDSAGLRYAVDLKSTYRINATTVNTMTLGAFTGYFRTRTSNKNVKYPYGEYCGHYVLGVIYDRAEVPIDERLVHKIEDIEKIPAVVRNLTFFAQPKYRIAKDLPGSGNTKNIGAIANLKDLLSGNGPFADLGEDVFDDYWMFYFTKDMVRAAELAKAPYKNLETYRSYKGLDKK